MLALSEKFFSSLHTTKTNCHPLLFIAIIFKKVTSFSLCLHLPLHFLVHKMLGKKFGSMKKLATKAKVIRTTSSTTIHHDQSQHLEYLLVKDDDQGSSPTSAKSSRRIGTFAVYVGEEKERFAVPTSYLSHPLFKILLEKTYNEFGFEQTNGLVVPCSVSAFQEVINAVECCNGKFDFGGLVEELL